MYLSRPRARRGSEWCPKAADGRDRRKAHGDDYECAVSWGFGAAHGQGVSKSCYSNKMHGGHAPVMGQLPARKQAQKYMADPGTLGRVCWAVVTAGRWPGVPGRCWHGTRATAQSDAPCAERGSGRCGLRRATLCPKPTRAHGAAQRDSVRCADDRVMAPAIGPARPLARTRPIDRPRRLLSPPLLPLRGVGGGPVETEPRLELRWRWRVWGSPVGQQPLAGWEHRRGPVAPEKLSAHRSARHHRPNACMLVSLRV